MIFFSILIAAGLFAIGRVVIGRIAPLESNPWLYKALTVCLVLHLIGAPVQIWVVDHLYGGIADYNRYDAQGAALAEGFRHLDYKDDHALNAAEWIVYDALYAYCQEMVRLGKRDGMFAK